MSGCLFALVFCLFGPSEPRYARPEMLLEPKALLEIVNGPTGAYLFLDVRPQAAFEQGHLPGAYWVDEKAWSNLVAQPGPAPLAACHDRPAAFFLPEVTLVVYDDGKTVSAARVWWLLRYWGCKKVQLLHGGYRGWQAVTGPVETGAPLCKQKITPPAAVQQRRLARKADVLANLNQGQIVDARSLGEYCGEDKRARRAGAMPNAKHLDWVDLIDGQTQRFKSAAQLDALFRTAGIDLKRPVITYCQSGGRAAVMAFALELMGAEQVSNYYASWNEWGNQDDTPIVTPAKKPR